MYKNVKKMAVSICIWAFVQVFFLVPGITCWWITFDSSAYDGLNDPMMYRIAYLFVAIISTVPFVFFWIKVVQLLIINRFNTLFEADADGFIPVAELAKEMGMSEAKLIKKTNNAIRKGYLINCNYSASQRAFLLSDKTGKPETQFPGMPANQPFIGVSCPSCAASLKIRATTQGTCPFCGRLIQAPPAN